MSILSSLLFSPYPTGDGSEQDAGVVFGCWLRSTHHSCPSTWMTLWFYEISSCVFLTYSIGFKKHFMMHRNYSFKNMDYPKSLKLIFFNVKSRRNSGLANIERGRQINCYEEAIHWSSYSFHQYSLKSERRKKQSQRSWSKTEKNDKMTHHTLSFCVGMCEFWHI